MWATSSTSFWFKSLIHFPYTYFKPLFGVRDLVYKSLIRRRIISKSFQLYTKINHRVSNSIAWYFKFCWVWDDNICFSILLSVWVFSGADPAILKRGVPNPGQKGGGIQIYVPGHSNALIGQEKAGGRGVPTPGPNASAK